MRQRDAVKECAKWLAYCLSIGWKEAELVELERMWWVHHDKYGNRIKLPPPPLEKTPWELVRKHQKELSDG